MSAGIHLSIYITHTHTLTRMHTHASTRTRTHTHTHARTHARTQALPEPVIRRHGKSLRRVPIGARHCERVSALHCSIYVVHQSSIAPSASSVGELRRRGPSARSVFLVREEECRHGVWHNGTLLERGQRAVLNDGDTVHLVKDPAPTFSPVQLVYTFVLGTPPTAIEPETKPDWDLGEQHGPGFDGPKRQVPTSQRCRALVLRSLWAAGRVLRAVRHASCGMLYVVCRVRAAWRSRCADVRAAWRARCTDAQGTASISCNKDLQCPVCAVALLGGVSAEPCMHSFCRNCVSRWLASDPTTATCPVPQGTRSTGAGYPTRSPEWPARPVNARAIQCRCSTAG